METNYFRVMYDEKDENSEHVFNVTRPFRNISIKCNNYIDRFIKENLTYAKKRPYLKGMVF